MKMLVMTIYLNHFVLEELIFMLGIQTFSKHFRKTQDSGESFLLRLMCTKCSIVYSTENKFANTFTKEF